MKNIAAFILPPRNPLAATPWIAGLAPAERAALALHRSGIGRVVLLAGRTGVDRTMLERLRARGLDVAVASDLQRERGIPGATLVLVSEDVVFEPGAVQTLVARLESTEFAGVAAVEAVHPGALAAVTAEGARELPGPPGDLFEAIDRLRSVRLGEPFCRVVSSRREIATIERAYISRGNSAERVTIRAARRLSVPISRVLLRMGVSANQVTLFGFALAIFAALLFSQRSLLAGIAGALIYSAGMVLGYSDGEVARASFSESKSGARLEAVSDYLSYFVVLAGLAWGELRYEGFSGYFQSAVLTAAALAGVLALRFAVVQRGGIAEARVPAAMRAIKE